MARHYIYGHRSPNEVKGRHLYWWDGQPSAQPYWSGEGDQTQPAKKRLGGGKFKGKRGRDRYPRRVFIEGKSYWVKNADEERALLAAYQARLEAEKEKLETVAPTPVVAEKVRKAAIKIARVERRIEKTATREAEWLERLRQEDDEILLMVH